MSDFLNSIKDYKIAVIGCGKTGLSGAKYLCKYAKEVILFDGNSNLSDATKELLKTENISFNENGISEEILDCDLIFLSPGVPRTLPVIAKAIAKGIDIVNDIELLSRIRPDAKIVAITGSNGKTTTTELTGEVFKTTFKTAVGGNIGTPVLDLIDDDYEVFVLELSSFQIESLKEFKADVVAVLNITPDHLDRYESMHHYAETKRDLLRMLKPNGIGVVNIDDANLSKELLCGIPTKSFSSTKKGDIYLEGENIIFKNSSILTSEIFIKGTHNYENIMSAILMADYFDIDFNVIENVVKSFKGVEHRLEFVREVNGVSYYNDSKATNPDSVVSALKSFDTPLIWLAGGRSKNTPFDNIVKLAKDRVKYALFFGESREIFASTFDGIINFHTVETVEDAILEANLIASNGDVVVLSPGCTSFDAYTSYTKRGEHFKQVVEKISEN